jgi:hypothetical protein
VIEEYSITNFGHGTPLDIAGSDHGEAAAPFMLDADISSTLLIASFWGIAAEQPKARTRPPAEAHSISSERPLGQAKASLFPHQAGIQRTIEDALRSAGLLK